MTLPAGLPRCLVPTAVSSTRARLTLSLDAETSAYGCQVQGSSVPGPNPGYYLGDDNVYHSSPSGASYKQHSGPYKHAGGGWKSRQINRKERLSSWIACLGMLYGEDGNGDSWGVVGRIFRRVWELDGTSSGSFSP
ncbi:hypothetical protein KM043_005364 [Ampulex compressa]|nr:hypothetical protein KM043_005364 [Ampulex compressa]